MENRRGNEIFLGVIGVATLLVAIIGATFAYFSASAQSANEAISVQSTELSLGFLDNADGLSTNLIPSAYEYVEMAGTNANWIAAAPEGFTHTDGKKYIGKGLCKDSTGNEICGVYTFTVGNPNFTTAMKIQGKLIITKNEFENLHFAIFDETNKKIYTDKFAASGEMNIDVFAQELVGSSLDQGEDGAAIEGFNPEDPSTYTPVVDKSNPVNANVNTNVRSYKIVVWVDEIDDDQTKVDSGKMFTAAIKFETESGKGVTGVIAAADAN